MTNKCSEFLGELIDYLDGTLDTGLCQEIERHIGQCPNCRIMIDTMRQTVILCRDGVSEKLPESLERKLEVALKIRWERKFRKN